MKVVVRLFATYRERVGSSTVTLDLPEEATVQMAWERLVEQYPSLGHLHHRVVASVNADYVPLDHPLHEGDELVFIPPVAGGASSAHRHFAIVEHTIDEAGLRRVVEHPGAGALLTFLGTTRNQTGGRRVEYLEYEAYEPLAIKQMRRIADEMMARWPDLLGIAIVHRIGRLEIGEASIGIAVSAPHRATAFAACRYAIDRAKETLPIWKKEVWEGGEAWIEEGPGTPL